MPCDAPAAVEAVQKAQSSVRSPKLLLMAAESAEGVNGALAALQLAITELQRHMQADSAGSGDVQSNVDALAVDLLAATAHVKRDAGGSRTTDHHAVCGVKHSCPIDSTPCQRSPMLSDAEALRIGQELSALLVSMRQGVSP